MNTKHTITCFVLCLVLNFGSIYCENVRSCQVPNIGNKQQLMKLLSPLTGKIFQVVQKEYTYIVAICGHMIQDPSSSVILHRGPNNFTVLGRKNDTDIMGKDSWLILSYGSGDLYQTEQCNGTSKASILISCNEDVIKPTLAFVEENKIWKNEGCFFMFELQTSAICPKEERLSNGSVFCISLLTTVGVYLVVGVFYRRIVKGAKGFEQIPHHEFWTKLGNLQADGCNFICRRDDRREESWRRLTNNFSDPQDDRDDALLRP